MSLHNNLKLVKYEFLSIIEDGINYTQKEIENYTSKVFGKIISKLTKLLFSFFALDRARKIGLKQLEFTLNCAKECIEDNIDIDKQVKNKFDEFAKYHIVYTRANKAHQKFDNLKKLMQQGFKVRLIIYTKLLSSTGSNYNELLLNAFPNKEEIKNLVEEQFEIVDKAQKLLEKEAKLLKVPAIIKTDVLKILTSSYDYEKKRLFTRIDNYYKS